MLIICPKQILVFLKFTDTNKNAGNYICIDYFMLENVLIVGQMDCFFCTNAQICWLDEKEDKIGSFW